MRIGIRQFRNDVVKWFKAAAGDKDYSRYGFTQELCQRADRAWPQRRIVRNSGLFVTAEWPRVN